MEKLHPTSSNTNLEPAPSWDAKPNSPPPATATADPLPPDSLSTNPSQTHNANSVNHEKTSTSPPPSPKPTIPPLTSHVHAVIFPPAPPVAATVPNNQIVPFVPLEINSNKQEMGQNGTGFGPGPSTTGSYGVPRAHVNMHSAAMGQVVRFPLQKADHQVPQPLAKNALVPVHDNNIVPAAAALLAPAARSSRLQPEGPSVILVSYVGIPWKSGIFDCWQHLINAIITTVAPCMTFGHIAEIVDNGSISCLTGAFPDLFLLLVICLWNIGVRYRKQLRNAFQISETPVTDWLAHVLGPLCSLCQEFRELKYRGLDPFLGYQGVIAGILHKQRQHVERETSLPLTK